MKKEECLLDEGSKCFNFFARMKRKCTVYSPLPTTKTNDEGRFSILSPPF